MLERQAFGVHYREALGLWRTSFNRNWQDAARLGFDEVFRRTWNSTSPTAKQGLPPNTLTSTSSSSAGSGRLGTDEGKTNALLIYAGAVQHGRKAVTGELADAVRPAEASDIEIHGTVPIAAAFFTLNRYVDGLGHDRAERSGVYAARAAVRGDWLPD